MIEMRKSLCTSYIENVLKLCNRSSILLRYLGPLIGPFFVAAWRNSSRLLLCCPWRQRPIMKWEGNSFNVKKDKSMEGFACPTPPSMGWTFARRGWVTSFHLANRCGSRFVKNTKLLRGVTGPISTPNDHLNTVFDDVVSLCRSCRNNTFPQSPREKKINFWQFSSCVWKGFFTKKEYAIFKSSRKMKIYSIG